MADPALLGDYGWFPDTALAIMALLATVTALAWCGRAAWVAGRRLAAYLFVFWLVLGGTSAVALVMFSVPGFFAGTVLRLRREAADELAQRGRELEEERELFAELALRHERARIAAELHDIIGHAISVMVIQAAAGQRLVDTRSGPGQAGLHRHRGVGAAGPGRPAAARRAARRNRGRPSRTCR